MEDLIINLAGSSTQLGCTYIQPGPGAPLRTMIVFLNGIDSPQTDWKPLIQLFNQRPGAENSPPVLLYDRVGQGISISSKKKRRDIMDAVLDLRGLLERIAELKLRMNRDEVDTVRTMFIGSSVGCSIARLYAQAYPKTIGAFLLLDPIPTSKDAMALFPDTAVPGFYDSPLPSPISAARLDDAKDAITKSLFDNTEGLWLPNISEYLPVSNLPKLQGPKPNTPLVTILVHDPEVFALQMKQKHGLDEIVNKMYLEPAWQQHSRGLMNITPAHLGRGPLIVKGCGHLIHVDDPPVVLNELALTLGRIRKSPFVTRNNPNYPSP